MGLTEDQTGEDRAAVRIPPPLISLIGIGVGAALHWFVWPLEIRAVGGAVGIVIGGLLVLIGLTVAGLAFLPFWRTGQDPKPWKPTPTMIGHGIYRYSRNPMYLGMGLIQAAIGVAAGILWIVVAVVPVLAAVHFAVIRHEEAYLEKKFGRAYLRYKESVRRWL